MVSASCLFDIAARAQVIPPGIVANFDISQRLEYSDNPDLDTDGESDFFGRTILGFGLESVTRLQRFNLDIGLDIEEGRNEQSSVDAKNPFVRLGYDRNTRNATLGFDFNYREADVESDIDPDDFDFDDGIIGQTTGIRESLSLGANGAVGREAPIGGSWSWNYNEITYRDTMDPDLTDQSRNALAGQVDFRINPKLTTSLTAEYEDFDAQGNGTNRESTGFGVATQMDISRLWSANLGVSYDRIKRSGDETGTDDGVSISANVEREMPDGSWGVRFASDVSSNDDGRRSFLSLTRQRDLPRGSLTYSLGVTGADVVGTDPLVDITYTHEMLTTQFDFGLRQEVVTDSDNDELINTRLSAGVNHQLNNLSSWGVSVNFFDVNDLSSNAGDQQRLDLRLTYNYDLTRDWGLVSGYSHSFLSEEGVSDRRRNTVFVGLQRNFSWNPSR